MFTLFDTRREEPQFISLQNLITSYVHIGDAFPSNAGVSQRTTTAASQWCHSGITVVLQWCSGSSKSL